MSETDKLGDLITDKTVDLTFQKDALKNEAIDSARAADAFDHEANALFHTAGSIPVAEALEDTDSE